jgi:hypothetical protein
VSGGLEVRGAAELVRTLHQAGADLGDLSAAGKRAGDLLVATARSRAPRRTGTLAASLSPVATTTGVRVASVVRYASAVHWGVPSRNMAANPFLADAVGARQDTLVGYYLDQVQTAVDGVRGA